ncbi:MAG: hypothetical protein SF053_00445 [Bacteroidia bacterium]|nr:hypothetical protein [Bacteroidia bacterium]
MKHLLIWCLVWLQASFFHATAQRPGAGERYPEGYIISVEGDTAWGFIRSATWFQDQRGIEFIDEYGTRTWYQSDRLSGFGYLDKHYLALPTPYLFAGAFSDSMIFLLRLIDGPARLYRFYTQHNVLTLKSGPGYIELIEKPDGRLYEVSTNFKFNRVSGAFEDYPELAAEIRQGYYKPHEILEIIRVYNQWYLKREKRAK